ncbi:hypothetical protein JZO81_08620 [Enterococcus hulanensis]|nr:hypothetical protein [Enterococcus hulanensis]OTO21559.1 hypothetical protein A5875_002941 [Enterococcus sp. 3H8_DIV0648]
MTSLKTMDRMDSIMKSKECMNCGSTKFNKVENGWKCDYCGTLYLNPKKETATTEKNTSEQSGLQKKKTRILIGVVLAIIFVLVGPLGYLTVSLNNTNTAYEPIEPGTVDSSEEEFPGEWNQSIYESIKVATENYDDNNEKYSFTGGSSYEELEKLVGTPDTVTSWEKETHGRSPRSMATWNKTKNGDFTSHSITVTYDKETKMITDKDHH